MSFPSLAFSGVTSRKQRNGTYTLKCECGWTVHGIEQSAVEPIGSLHSRLSTQGISHMDDLIEIPLRPNTSEHRIINGRTL